VSAQRPDADHFWNLDFDDLACGPFCEITPRLPLFWPPSFSHRAMRHAFLLLLSLAITGLAADSAAAKPNVIFIVADDMGYADTGFQGCKDIPTPNLDALAKSGVRCTDGYVSHPFCSPTRAGLMTGRYQQRFGHENNPVFKPGDTMAGLPVTETLLPRLLHDAGYVTGWVGKWHLGAAECFHPNTRGFTDAYGFLGGGHQYFADGLNKPDVEYYTPLQRNGKEQAETGYLTDIFGREAVAFVEQHAKEPFFLYLAFNCPHTPLQAPDHYLNRVGSEITDEKRKVYAAMVIAQDDAVGKLMEKLRSLALEENTLICFISDNGGPVGERSNGSSNGALRAGKGTVYEGGIRVPFFLRWKGTLPSGKEYHQPVISLDLTRTALELAGGHEAGGKPMDGVNLVPFLKGEKSGAPHEALFWRTGGGDQYAVRHGDMKLVLRKGEAQPELFDLAKDVGESKDLANAMPDQVKQLDALRQNWNAELVAPVFSGPPGPKQPAAKNRKSK
jgi:arylsulfatase A-like enzyme